MRKLCNRGWCTTQPRVQTYNLQGSSLEIQIGGVSEVRVTLKLRAYRLKASFSADIENGKSRLLPEMCIGTCLWIAREALEGSSATNRRPFRSGGDGGGLVHTLHKG